MSLRPVVRKLVGPPRGPFKTEKQRIRLNHLGCNMDLETARAQMVAQQVRAWDVLDPRVLQVLGTIQRERFVPDRLRKLAFADTRLPLAHEQYMMAPNVEGRVLQTLDLDEKDTVLEIGTGSGFLTACLAKLAASVSSVDIFEDFVIAADAKLAENDIKNVNLDVLDATLFEAKGQYDAIAVTASLPVYDSRFERALKPAGRLFVIVGEGDAMEARRVTRTSETEWLTECLFETAIPAMINAAKPASFQF